MTLLWFILKFTTVLGSHILNCANRLWGFSLPIAVKGQLALIKACLEEEQFNESFVLDCLKGSGKIAGDSTWLDEVSLLDISAFFSSLLGDSKCFSLAVNKHQCYLLFTPDSKSSMVQQHPPVTTCKGFLMHWT